MNRRAETVGKGKEGIAIEFRSAESANKWCVFDSRVAELVESFGTAGKSPKVSTTSATAKTSKSNLDEALALRQFLILGFCVVDFARSPYRPFANGILANPTTLVFNLNEAPASSQNQTNNTGHYFFFLAVFFLVAFFLVDFFFAVTFFVAAFFVAAFFVAAFFAAFFFFLPPKILSKLLEYFSFVPTRKIVMLRQWG